MSEVVYDLEMDRSVHGEADSNEDPSVARFKGIRIGFCERSCGKEHCPTNASHFH